MSGRSVGFKGGFRFVTDEKWVLSEVMLKCERAEGSDFFKVPSERS